MAIYHLSATPVQRSKGHSAVAGAAYRAGEKLREVRTGQQHDYTRKSGVVMSEIVAPDHAQEWVYTRETLWNRAELAERRYDAQPAREVRVALPHELDDEQRADLVFDFVQDVFVKEGMVADVSIHRPDRHGDERNHHAHILLTMRELDGEAFSPRKQREWNRKETLETWREEWEAYVNDALEDAGSDARVDHRTLDAQGSHRMATEHMGKDANALERRGERTERGDINRDIHEHNRYLDGLVNELAAVEAEIAKELEKEFSGQETQTPIVTDSAVTIEPEPEPPPLSWEEQKRQAQDPFTYEVALELKRQIREEGAIRMDGQGKNWFDRTVAYFENLYYDTVDRVKDTWARYITEREPPPDRDDYEPER